MDIAVKRNGIKSRSNKSMIVGHLPLPLVIATSFCICVPPSSAQANGVVWKLEQKRDTLGQLDVYISHDAVKIVSLEWGYQLVAKAPKWTVHCFRPRERIEWIGELNHFNGAMLNSPFEEGTMDSSRLGAFGTGVLKGLKYTRYAPSRSSLAAIYGANDISVAPEAAEFVCRLYDMSNPGKIPLYRTSFKDQSAARSRPKEEWLSIKTGKDLRTGLVVELVTKSWKKLPFDASVFENPRGYKSLNKLSDVAFTSGQKAGLNEMLDNVGFASDKGGSIKKMPASAPGPSTGAR